NKLEGKVAIVTGGGQGIGRAISLRLAKDGANVVVLDMNLDNANSVVSEIQKMNRKGLAKLVDVRDKDIIRSVIDEIYSELGSIDILVNNAGAARHNAIFDITEEELDLQFDVNVKGLFFCLQSVAKHMTNQGAGKIINLASQAGRRGEAHGLSYCMSKAAVISVTQSAALALSPYKVNVNAVSPGVVDTPLWETIDKKFSEIRNIPLGQAKREAVESIPLGRIEQPEDVANVVSFLAGSDSDYMTGQTVNVDGGNVMS